ncbi:MAG TPA: manganese-dependent inorganic pyrophosphatase, partial [Candidatus Aenigmarchaeota archaeon]|nr:manganese-dependent inorganic pyrophosphatase [Candidatus Aenigmarchaeota archaeon]
SAIAYARFKERVCEGRYIPARAGDINPETRFVLEHFNIREPELLENAEGKKLILVDHNEATQAISGLEGAEILEVIDHHKVNFRYDRPIYFLSKPLGSTATIIAEMFFSKGLEIEKGIAGILLSSILSDTVIFKSPTTTEMDREIAEKLAEISGISDIQGFGIEIKKAKSSIKGLSASEVILSDFKDFDLRGKKVGIGQIEVVDMKEVLERKEEILQELNRIKDERGYALVILAATDIINEGSELLIAGDKSKVEEAFGKRIENSSVYIQGLMSRKKQITPALERVF